MNCFRFVLFSRDIWFVSSTGQTCPEGKSTNRTQVLCEVLHPTLSRKTREIDHNTGNYVQTNKHPTNTSQVSYSQHKQIGKMDLKQTNLIWWAFLSQNLLKSSNMYSPSILYRPTYSYTLLTKARTKLFLKLLLMAGREEWSFCVLEKSRSV